MPLKSEHNIRIISGMNHDFERLFQAYNQDDDCFFDNYYIQKDADGKKAISRVYSCWLMAERFDGVQWRAVGGFSGNPDYQSNYERTLKGILCFVAWEAYASIKSPLKKWYDIQNLIQDECEDQIALIKENKSAICSYIKNIDDSKGHMTRRLEKCLDGNKCEIVAPLAAIRNLMLHGKLGAYSETAAISESIGAIVQKTITHDIKLSLKSFF